MTPEEKKVVRAAIAWYQGSESRLGAKARGLGALYSATQALVFACNDCNAGGHTCPGDGDPIPHGATNCDAHDYHPLDARNTEIAQKDAHSHDTYPCVDCLVDPTEDPLPWCDCPPDESQCRRNEPCRRRAHAPDRCPNMPRCGADGETRSKKTYGVCVYPVHGPETQHSWYEEWVPTTWRHVRDDDLVRLGGQEAEVETVSVQEWHVDPNSNPRYPTAWDHTEVRARLSGRPDPLTFPPNGPIEILMNVERSAIHNLAKLGEVMEVKS